MLHTTPLLAERAAEWRGLPRCTAEERALAESFYATQVLPLVRADFVQREHARLPRRYEGLILSVGWDPTPAVLSLATLQPERVHWLFTGDSEPAVDAALAAVRRRATPYDRTRLDAQPLLEAYAAVTEVADEWGAPADTAVDITGGPAAASAGMALAAYALGAGLICIEAAEWWPDVGRPRPGSQYLTFPAPPYLPWGDLTRREAERAIAQGAYGLARELYALLAQTVDPRLFAPYRDLAAAYEAWDDLDPPRARRSLEDVLAALEAQPAHPLAPHRPRLEAQAAALARVAPLANAEAEPPELATLNDGELVADLAFYLREHARRQARAGRFTLAVLVQYRLLELLVQRRLAVHGLSTARPDYAALAVPDLAQRFAELQAARHAPETTPELPPYVGVSDGLLLLEILGDPLADAVDWALLEHCLPTRSRSVLVHGFRWPQAPAYQEWEQLLAPAWNRFCQIEGIDESQRQGMHRFVSWG